VRSNTARVTVIDDESGAACALINGANEGSLLCFCHFLIERQTGNKHKKTHCLGAPPKWKAKIFKILF